MVKIIYNMQTTCVQPLFKDPFCAIAVNTLLLPYKDTSANAIYGNNRIDCRSHT